jgi:hypothetical protein
MKGVTELRSQKGLFENVTEVMVNGPDDVYVLNRQREAGTKRLGLHRRSEVGSHVDDQGHPARPRQRGIRSHRRIVMTH